MKKMKVAVIGCGKIANAAHGPSYAKNPNAEIAWCVDILPDRAASFAKTHGGEKAKAAEDYREMLKDPTVDAVSVCVPNYLHAPITVDCMDAGKHVLCEKPAAMNYAQAMQMKKAADRNGRILNIGVVNRFNTAVNKVKNMILAGELGDVYHVYCSFRSHRSIPGLGGPFTTKAQSGGGVLIDWGVHFLDLLNYCIGSPAVRSVSGAAYGKLGRNMRDYVYTDMWAGPPDYNGTYDVEEFITGIVRTDGPTITLNGAWAQNIGESAMFIEFLGDKAGVKLQYGANFTVYGVKDGMLVTSTPSFASADMFYEEIDAFLMSAAENKKIRSHIDEVLVTARMMDGLYESATTGREVRFE